ncbi:hypothetical protein SAMN04487895_105234 [Paenibacillus sophorae]|uniref:Uncharacterized protein n=1 Tax=Paenibacillus sophorae TaxID=1333845 RepID=A0A1H8MH96_9BACL|nr:hypothetical protein [Paenibacillus sophorae]QWU17815.1 hypothetical protein KP014_12145 [Paenibacillus sophorae]SEO16755.1 hypothetical protein SAMN04487895_105234 [Paenibacillus sophorae]
MLKQAVRAGLFLMLAFLLSSQPLFAAGKTVKIKVTLVSAELVDNEHVGNEWWWGGYVNGKELEEGSSVTVNVSSSISIKLRAEAQEQDKYPEDGTANATVKVASIKSSLNKTLNVTVVENRGRYSGNTAKWRFVFKIQKL